MNPYESPAAVNLEQPAAQYRRPAMGTFLVGLWLLEGGVKAVLLGAVALRLFDSFEYLAPQYASSNRVVFFLVSLFFVVETIGPWIGIYYLTGSRARNIAFDKALLRILKTAVGIAVIASLAVLFYLELAAWISA